MKIVIKEMMLKEKNRKKRWVWTCKICEEKLYLDSGDTYYEVKGINPNGIQSRIIFNRTCSYECAKKYGRDIAKILFSERKYGKKGVNSEVMNPIINQKNIESFYETILIEEQI
jgi:hypothetical protein